MISSLAIDLSAAYRPRRARSLPAQEDGVIDAAVFCLSLMGTTLVENVVEAHRVMASGGLLKIAEVKSRFVGAAKVGL